MLNVGGTAPRQGPLVRGLAIAFYMFGQQTTFVWRLVLLIWRRKGGREGLGRGGGWWQASQVSLPSGVGGGGFVSSLTFQRPLWMGSNQPRKRVDLAGMHKKVEMGETKV